MYHTNLNIMLNMQGCVICLLLAFGWAAAAYVRYSFLLNKVRKFLREIIFHLPYTLHTHMKNKYFFHFKCVFVNEIQISSIVLTLLIKDVF